MNGPIGRRRTPGGMAENGLAALVLCAPEALACSIGAWPGSASRFRRLARLGLPSYRRGHFGHGVGPSVFSEQSRFTAADSGVAIGPDMVLAFGIPLYVEGVASYNLKEQVRVTPEGPQTTSTIGRELGVIACAPARHPSSGPRRPRDPAPWSVRRRRGR